MVLPETTIDQEEKKHGEEKPCLLSWLGLKISFLWFVG